MEHTDALRFLNRALLEEMPELRTQAAEYSQGTPAQRKLLRSLMNLRPPMPLTADFLTVQDLWLSRERDRRGIVEAALLPVIASNPKLALWQGDITRLGADAIVNAANSSLLGCFHPCHGCIDNAHPLSSRPSAAGCLLSPYKRAGTSRTNRRGQAHTWLQSPSQVRPPHRGSHHPGPCDRSGPGSTGLLLPLLPRTGVPPWTCNRRVLLHLHRRISLSKSRSCRNRRENRHGRFANAYLHSKGDLECFHRFGRTNLPVSPRP